MMKKSVSSFLMVGMFLSAYSYGQDLATVNGQGISAEEFKRAVASLGQNKEVIARNENLKKRFLDHLIENKLLISKAKEEKLENSKAFADRMKQVEDQVLADLYIESYIEKNTADKPLEEYFNNHKSEFHSKEVKAANILFKKEDKAKAEEVLKEAQKPGVDFAELAKKHSIGPNGSKGGDLGWISKGYMVPEIEEMAFKMEKGSVSPALIQTPAGYHILKVYDVKGTEEVTFADIKERVRQKLTKELREKLLDTLKESAKISINEESLKKLAL